MLNKFGSPTKINVVTGSFAFDANLIVKMLQDKVPSKTLTLDQLHEAIKSIGVVDYTSDDMSKLLSLLQSVGLQILK